MRARSTVTSARLTLWRSTMRLEWRGTISLVSNGGYSGIGLDKVMRESGMNTVGEHGGGSGLWSICVRPISCLVMQL